MIFVINIGRHATLDLEGVEAVASCSYSSSIVFAEPVTAPHLYMRHKLCQCMQPEWSRQGLRPNSDCMDPFIKVTASCSRCTLGVQPVALGERPMDAQQHSLKSGGEPASHRGLMSNAPRAYPGILRGNPEIFGVIHIALSMFSCEMCSETIAAMLEADCMAIVLLVHELDG